MMMLDKIERLRADKGLSQEELQALCGLADARISKWLGGKGEPSARQAARIAGALGVPLAWLVNDAADWPPPGTEATPYVEKVAVDLVRDLGLTVTDVIRGLTGQAPRPTPEQAARIEAKRAAAELTGEIIRRERAERAATPTPRKRRNGGD